MSAFPTGELAQRALCGHTGASVMTMICMPDTNFYATLKKAGLAVSPAVNAYSESIRLDLLCNKIRKIKSNLF